MPKHVVGTVAEIPPGGRKIVELRGRSIGVFNVGGEFFALRNRCPHQGAALCEGPLGSCVTSSSPGHYEMSRAGEMLRCPWHGWEFDLRTGQSWFDPKSVRVKSYEVAVQPGKELAGWSERSACAEQTGRSDQKPVRPSVAAPSTSSGRCAGIEGLAPPAPGLAPGPYIAESYPVSVEENYVVVEL